MGTEPKSYRHVRAAICFVDSRLNIRKHFGCSSYYWTTENKLLAEKMAASTKERTIYVAHWSQYSLEQWQAEAREFLAAIEGGEQ